MQTLLIFNWQTILLISILILVLQPNGFTIRFTDNSSIFILLRSLHIIPILKKFNAKDRMIASQIIQIDRHSTLERKYWQGYIIVFLCFEIHFCLIKSRAKEILEMFPKNYNYKTDLNNEDKILRYNELMQDF